MTHKFPDNYVHEFTKLKLKCDGDVKRNSHAILAKSLISKIGNATLSTFCTVNEEQFPFGSIIKVAEDKQGRLFFVASKIAEHFKNLQVSNRASIIVSDNASAENNLASNRVTVVGTVQVLNDYVSAEVVKQYEDAYVARFPSAAKYAHFKDMVICRMEAKMVRYIHGFGEMSFVSAEEFTNALADPILSSDYTNYAISHMNKDHLGDLNVIIQKRLADENNKVEASLVSGFDQYGMDVIATLQNGNKAMLKIPFPSKLTDAKQLREEVKKLMD